MIIINKDLIREIPCLIISEEDKITVPLPTVVYYHGFNGEKEASLTIAYKLAEKGMRVVLPDSLYHGERTADISQTEREMGFWQTVMKNIAEVKVIYDYLQENELLLDHRIGLAGTSMGGMTTFAALAKYDWIKVAVSVMGTPKLINYAETLIEGINQIRPGRVSEEEAQAVIEMLDPVDLTRHPKLLNGRPLLIWHGENDDVIPISHVNDFTEQIGGQNIRLVKEPNRMHHVSRLAVEETVGWFSEKL